ncbi:MAG TPA: Asd/ArgC dimerization domain-containing protein [Bryobacteraceae bacterium]|nr:Asd/ArgC dimerization domain-containing protein [Bryobacteraceae bacterium]
MGREIRDLVATAGLHGLRLIAEDDEVAGILTEQGGEPTLATGLTPDSLDNARVVFLAGSTQSARKALDMATDAVAIDLTYTAEERPNARLRAPMAEPEGYSAPADAVQVIAHPAAIAIALVLRRINEVHPIRRTVIHVFEPASERGKSGIEELQQQTVGLLSFKSLPKAVYDEQLSFNMLARYGEEAPVALEDVEARLERHLATLLALAEDPIPMPSVRLIQAPVFHGYSISLWIEFEENPGAAEVEAVLAVPNVDVRDAALGPPNTVGMAGQSGIAIGAVTVDRNDPDACWLWLAADNLRLAAENAVAVARQYL